MTCAYQSLSTFFPFAIARYSRFIIHFACPRLVIGYFFKEKPTFFPWGMVFGNQDLGANGMSLFLGPFREQSQKMHCLCTMSSFRFFRFRSLIHLSSSPFPVPCLYLISLMVRTLVLNNISIYYLVDPIRCKIISELLHENHQQ